MCRLLGFFASDDQERRLAWRRRFVVLLTVVPAALFLVFESPVRMVVAGGIAQSILLPLVGAGTLYLHHRRLPAEVAPWPAVTIALWAATLGMGVFAVSSLWLVFGR
jgi:hypothetical protein